MNTDRLNGMHPYDAASAAFLVVSGLDGLPTPEQKVAALAVAFVTVAQEAGLDISQLINQAQRMARDADTYFDGRLSAIREWARGEVA